MTVRASHGVVGGRTRCPSRSGVSRVRTSSISPNRPFGRSGAGWHADASPSATLPRTGREPQRDVVAGRAACPARGEASGSPGRGSLLSQTTLAQKAKPASRRAPREEESRRAGGVRGILTRSALQRVSGGGVSKRRLGLGSGAMRRTGRRLPAAAQREPHLDALVRGGVHAGTRLHGRQDQ